LVSRRAYRGSPEGRSLLEDHQALLWLGAEVAVDRHYASDVGRVVVGKPGEPFQSLRSLSSPPSTMLIDSLGLAQAKEISYVEENKMKKGLFRMLALAGVLSVASLANATDQGKCYIQCDSTNVGPYWSTDADCCRDFENLCGSVGLAYTVYGSPPHQSVHECAAS
jgi:hypothetical protein